jgi:hypothetical protein
MGSSACVDRCRKEAEESGVWMSRALWGVFWAQPVRVPYTGGDTDSDIIPELAQNVHQAS